METLSGFDFLPFEYDGDGRAIAAPTAAFTQHLGASGVTDAIVIAHGFRNDPKDARRLYGDFLHSFAAHVDLPALQPRLSGRKIAVAGIFWPSKAFSEDRGGDEAGSVQSTGDATGEQATTRAQLLELRDDVRPEQRAAVDRAVALLDRLEDDAAAQDEIVEVLLSLAEEHEPDPSEGLAELKAQAGSDLLARLGQPIILPTIRDDGDGQVLAGALGTPVAGDGRPLFVTGVFRSIAGRVGQVLNIATWYIMKDRSGNVGTNGVAPLVRAIATAHPSVRVHLVGHSLGGRCMTACAKALAADLAARPASLTLLEAAFSHYGLSPDNGRGSAGFFRDVIARDVVRGPFISTYSYQDLVVGKAYAIASRLADDNVKAIGDKNDQFGGIGRNGSQLTPESTNQRMREVGDEYTFPSHVVNNLDGSDGIITSHSDVTNPRVAWAFACAVAQTT